MLKIVTKWLGDWVTEWPSDWVTKWPSDQVTKWLSDWVIEWPSAQVPKCPSDQVTKWLCDRKLRRRLTEWYIVQMSDAAGCWVWPVSALSINRWRCSAPAASLITIAAADGSWLSRTRALVTPCHSSLPQPAYLGAGSGQWSGWI